MINLEFTRGKHLSTAHKAKISRALTKNKAKKQRKEEGGIKGFFATIARIRTENEQIRGKQKDWETHTATVDSDQMVKIANEYEKKHGIGTAFNPGGIKNFNKPENMARIYHYKTGKDFLRSRRENNKAKSLIEKRPFIQRFL